MTNQLFGHTSRGHLPPAPVQSQTAHMAPKKQLDHGRVDELLDALWDLGATDLILTVGAPPMMRLDGELKPFNKDAPLTNDDTSEMLDAVLTSQNRDPLGERE